MYILYFEYKCRGGLPQPIFLSKLSISEHSGSICTCIEEAKKVNFFSAKGAEGGSELSGHIRKNLIFFIDALLYVV